MLVGKSKFTAEFNLELYDFRDELVPELHGREEVCLGDFIGAAFHHKEAV